LQLEEIATNSIIGCCTNELVDALPVHQFIIEAEQHDLRHDTGSEGIAYLLK